MLLLLCSVDGISRTNKVTVIRHTLWTQIDLGNSFQSAHGYQTVLADTKPVCTSVGTMASRPTIHDVARRAGVSATTVSHAFSGKGTVAPATRQHVRDVARSLGYRPDILAQGLRSNRLGVIALILRPLDDYTNSGAWGIDYFMRFTGAAALAALAAGYGLMLVGDPSHDEGPGAALACDGCLVTEPIADDPLLDLLAKKEIPVVTVGRDVAREGSELTVDAQTTTITDDVLAHLVAAGATRIALITGTATNSWNIDSASAYRAWCAAHLMEPRVAEVPEDDGIGGGYRAARELFAREPPDAIYCLTGRQAVGALEFLHDNKIRVPDDVLLCCGSDAERLRSTTPAITAVDLRPEALARIAVTTLIDALTGHSSERQDDSAARLLVRDSTTRP